jgi:hypothetical protein
MTNEPEDLERHVHRVLAELPSPRAPRTLRPRVMDAVAPGVVGRPWFTWPWPVQVATVLAAVACVGGLVWAWPTLLAAAGAAVPGPVQTGAGYMEGVAETSSALVRLLRLTWSAVVAPLAKLVLLLTVMLCTACAVCLAALSRMALGGASQS